MTAAASKEPVEFPNLDLNLDRTARPQSEPADLFWEGDTLNWVGVRNMDCSAFKELASDIHRSLREHIISFAQSGKCAPQSWASAVKAINASLVQACTREFNLAWLVKALTTPSFQVYKGSIASFFIYWHDRYPKAITSDALQLLARPLTRNARPLNVLSDDPEKGWLTDLEYDALLRSTWDNYDQGITGTQITLMRLLSLQYARRPAQLANLKIGDFRDGSVPGDNTGERRIHFPGAKDRGAQENFRDSKEEVHPVAGHLWDLFQIQEQEVKALFEQHLGRSLTEPELAQLPVFTSQLQVEQAINTLTGHYRSDWQTNLASPLFHLPFGTASKIMCWNSNTLGDNSVKTPKPTPPISHRTGRSIQITATRMRHTRARQLARLGTPRHVLSFWLGHATEKTLDSYYNDPAEEARQLNDAMKGALVPLAMAFTGRLLDDESHATRANDPESTLEFAAQGNLKNVGKCGKHSFCATTSVPIPCYRCKMFEPLVHAPHEEVLDALLKRQAEEDAMIKIGGARKLLTPIDLGPDIRAVQACIARCNARKAELEASHG
jgi:integrase